MKPVQLLTEADLTYFMNPSTVKDAEVLMNSAILMRKHIDMNKGETNTYVVRLMDGKTGDGTSYHVHSHTYGLEAIRSIVNKHKILEEPPESETSTWICFFVR